LSCADLVRTAHAGAPPIRPMPRITVREVRELQTFPIVIPQSVVDSTAREHDR